VIRRLMDAVDPKLVDHVEDVLSHVVGVQEVGALRPRWIGDRLHREANVVVDQDLSVAEGHAIAEQAPSSTRCRASLMPPYTPTRVRMTAATPTSPSPTTTADAQRVPALERSRTTAGGWDAAAGAVGRSDHRYRRHRQPDKLARLDGVAALARS
jgi:Dimerisation domain of Zinc Transporter